MIIGNSFVYQGDFKELIQQGLPMWQCGNYSTGSLFHWDPINSSNSMSRKAGGFFCLCL